MSADMHCQECGEIVRVRLHPGRNFKSRAAHRGSPVKLKDHDLCPRCWRTLMNAEVTEQRRALWTPGLVFACACST